MPAGDATPAQEEAYLQAIIRRVEVIHDRTAARLTRHDKQLRAAQRRHDARAVAPATMFLFAPGDLVLQRTKAWHRGSRLTAKGHGPYRVLEVRGLCGQRVLVEPAEDPSTRRRARPHWVHAALLVPYLEGWSPPELVWDEEEPVASSRGAAQQS
ncbi:MAG TPA: hypothetical protein VK150_06040 [Geothrix sp.]|nr:hypothetical protein [Geothrix sp.]